MAGEVSFDLNYKLRLMTPLSINLYIKTTHGLSE